jgi:hypothetical protein
LTSPEATNEAQKVRKDQFVFLLGGLAFGFLFGFGIYHTWYAAPGLQAHPGAPAASAGMPSSGPPSSSMPSSSMPSSSMPTAPTPSTNQTGAPAAGGAAPMLAEINQLKRTVTDDPKNLAAWVRLGNLHYDVQMWDQAAGYYEKAVELDPTNPDVLTDLGVCYRGMKQFDKALDVFERAHQADPNHYQSLFNIVIVAGFDVRQFDRAEEALRALQAMNPQPPRLNELSQALAEQRAAAGGGAS